MVQCCVSSGPVRNFHYSSNLDCKLPCFGIKKMTLLLERVSLPSWIPKKTYADSEVYVVSTLRTRCFLLSTGIESQSMFGSKRNFQLRRRVLRLYSLAPISDSDSKSCVEEIPSGRVTSYGHIARLLGRRMWMSTLVHSISAMNFA